MKTTIENGNIYVKSEYNRDFISRAKTIQGKWQAPCWVFPEDNINEVRDLLLDVYGECGSLAEQEISTVTVDIDLDKYSDVGEAVKLGSLTAVKRTERDREVVFSDNVMLISGGFYSSGGSRANPRVSPKEGTVIRVKNLPDRIYLKIKDMDGVTLVSSPEKEVLIAEREQLMKRLAELNELIGDAV